MNKNKDFIVINLQKGSISESTREEAIQQEEDGYCTWKASDTEVFYYHKDFWENLDIQKIMEMKEEIIELKKAKDYSISWGIDDFESRAKEREESNDEIIYNRDKFNFACLEMIRKHDCNIGITWDVIDFYLDELCQTDFYKKHSRYWHEISVETALRLWEKESIFAYEVSTKTDWKINTSKIIKTGLSRFDHLMLEVKE